MSNQDTIKDEYASQLCETAYRIWLSGFKFPETEKEVLVEDIYYFYQDIPWYISYPDTLDTFIKEWKLDWAYRDWYNFYEQFIS